MNAEMDIPRNQWRSTGGEAFYEKKINKDLFFCLEGKIIVFFHQFSFQSVDFVRSHLCAPLVSHHFWVGATVNPPKSDDRYAQLT